MALIGIDDPPDVQIVRLRSVRQLLCTDSVFIFVGTLPSSEFLDNAVSLDQDGFVIVNKEMETSVPGIFAAGDVISKRLRQISSSVGEGATAAFNAEEYLESL